MKSKKLLLVMTAATLVVGLSSCTSKSQVSTGSDTATSASVAPVAHDIAIEKDEHVNVYTSVKSALAGVNVVVTAVVEGDSYLYSEAITMNGTALTMTPDSINAGVITGSFTMPDEAVTIKAVSTLVTYKVNLTVPDGVAGLFFDQAPTDALIEAGTYTTSLEDGVMGKTYYFEPVSLKTLDVTKMIGNVTIAGEVVDYTDYNSYGNYYGFTFPDADVEISVALTDKTYLAYGYSKNSSHVVLNFKGNASYSYHFARSKAGDTVTFTTTVDAGYGLDYIIAYAIDSSTGKVAGLVDVTFDPSKYSYSFTQPSAVVWIVAGVEATAFPITLNKVAVDEKTDLYEKNYVTFRSGITVEHGNEKTSLSISDGYKAQYGDLVTISATDGSDAYKITDVTLNGESVGEPTIDGSGDYVYSFLMPASQAVLAITADFDTHDITVTASSHFTATTELITAAATTGDPDVETAITSSYAGQKVYIKTNATEVQDATDSKYYQLSAPTASYITKDSSGNDVTNAVTVSYDSTKALYYFTMPKYAVTVTLNEALETYHGEAFVGTYYGGYNGNTSTKMSIDVTGAIVWDSGSYKTSDVAITKNNDGTVSGSFKLVRYGTTYVYTFAIKGDFLGLYYVEEGGTLSSTSNVYIMTKNTAAPKAAAYASDSTNKTYLYSITPNGATDASFVYFDMTAKTFKFGVLVTLIKGTTWTDSGSRIKIMDGTTEIGVYDIGGSTYSRTMTKVASDAVAGSYKLASATEDTLSLDGYGIATYNGVTGTYTVVSATQVTVVTSVSGTVTTTTIDLDTTAKTYAVNGTPVSVTLPEFAGSSYRNSTINYREWMNDSYQTDGVGTFAFSATASTLTFTLTNPDGYEFGASGYPTKITRSDIAYTYDATAKTVTFTMNDSQGTSTVFTLTYDATAKTMTMDKNFGTKSNYAITTANVAFALVA